MFSENVTATTKDYFKTFTTKQSKYHNFSKVEKALSKSPKKTSEMVKTLVKKFDVKIQMKLKKRKKKILNQEERFYLIDFLNPLGMTYTNPGMKDVVYLGKSNGLNTANMR